MQAHRVLVADELGAGSIGSSLMRNRCISIITSMLSSLARARSAARPTKEEEKENEETETEDDNDDVMRAGDIQNVVLAFGCALVYSGLSPDRRGRPLGFLARSIFHAHNTSSIWLSWPMKTAACFNVAGSNNWPNRTTVPARKTGLLQNGPA